ncbi:MAG TPA: aldo/keto reductase [Methanomassiliicoccales archaeon]|jgi:diketogulonate reductase-like aldo/keto reductase|nr:aldo/keto reductase [Methanomassiliicoccales archaeon]HQM66427.1 aldo/keto reductase [Methanomassiliicoccales archaeon]
MVKGHGASDVMLRLNNGVEVPALGLGTYKLVGEAAYAPVRAALGCGYRHIDTASFYENEEAVGRAVRESGVPREEVFITSKVWNTEQGYDRTLQACERSLARLGTDHLDLYLVHWPVPGKRLETYRALERLYEEGRVRAIGVSNFTVRHLEELYGACQVMPAVNQVEMSPFLYQKELLEHCRGRNVLVTAFSPLARGRVLGDPVLAEVAARHRRSPAQVMIRWCLQKGMAVIPRSADPAHIKENADVFDFSLDEEDMARLDLLHTGLRTTTDPDIYE